MITPAKLKDYLVEKRRPWAPQPAPPYHVAFVIGGTSSAEATLKTVKLASTKYYDSLPTEGNAYGQAFRDVQLEEDLLKRSPEPWPGRAVRRQIFRARYPRGSSAAPRCILPRRHERVLFSRT